MTGHTLNTDILCAAALDLAEALGLDKGRIAIDVSVAKETASVSIVLRKERQIGFMERKSKKELDRPLYKL